MSSIISSFYDIFEKTGVQSSLLSPLFKIIAIGYIAEFSSDLLVDFGNSSLADKVILAGKFAIILLSLPIFESLLKLVQGFLNV